MESSLKSQSTTLGNVKPLSRIPPELKVIIPEDRVALYPAERRDQSRMLVYDRDMGKVIHVGIFSDIVNFIHDDLLVLNQTQVIPVFVEGKKIPGGGKVEILFLASPSEGMPDLSLLSASENTSDGVSISALVNPGRRLHSGQVIALPGDAVYTLGEKLPDGKWQGVWQAEGIDFLSWLDINGSAPLPPYIRRAPELEDRNRYQTVYASVPGSLAAPTAGLHFTNDVLDTLEANGAEIAKLHLDVGLGTFLPIRGDDLLHHKMHRETYYLSPETADLINSAKAKGRTVTAVGTTVVRALENAAKCALPLQSGGETADIFIFPPYQYKIVDRLVTNFHRPDSTLMQLLAAFIGWDGINESYGVAMESNFKFFSYGDSMMVL